MNNAIYELASWIFLGWYLLLCFVVAYTAKHRKADSAAYFFLAIIGTPLLAAVLLSVVPKKKSHNEVVEELECVRLAREYHLITEDQFFKESEMLRNQYNNLRSKIIF